MSKRQKSLAIAPVSGGRRQILVRNLVVPMTIGFFGHERDRVQPVLVGLRLTVEDTPIRDGDLDSVVNYVALVDEIRRLSLNKTIKLAETLAEHIVDICLKDRRVLTACVRVEKPHAIHDVEAAGVEVERSRKQRTRKND